MGTSWGNKNQQEDAPIYVVDAATGRTGTEEYGNTVHAVLTTEVSGTEKTPGWNRIVEGTGNRAGRIFVENLVAMKSIQAAPTPPEDEDEEDGV